MILNAKSFKNCIKEDASKIFPDDFNKSINKFIADILKDPIHADVDDFFKGYGFTKNDIIKKLKEYAILSGNRKINEVPKDDDENDLHGVMNISYKLKGNRFREKKEAMFNELFKDKKPINMKIITITESQLRRLAKSGLIKEDGICGIGGDGGAGMAYDAPVGFGDKETKKHNAKDFKNGTLTTQHASDEGTDVIRKSPQTYTPKQNK